MKKILVFSLFWFIINLVQASLMEINFDEAYYWVYSKFLDWGYFDHPPVIAVMIKAGYFIFHNELGVRLVSVLMGTGTVFLILYMIKDKVEDLRLAMLILFAVPLLHFHVAGCFAIPDIPLVFFTTVFFFLYRKFLTGSNLLIMFLLSLTIALMFYSKYHSSLIIGFTVLSNLKLLKRKDFWLVAVLAVLLFVPHILWQIKHDFTTFSYHLVDRNKPFALRHVFDYLGGQILLLGPATGAVLFYFGVREKAEDPFSKTLKFNFLGIFLFFLFSSIKGHVEAHWTAAGYIPLLLYTLPMTNKITPVFKKRLFMPASMIFLIFLARLVLIVDFGLIPDKLNNRYHGQDETMVALSKVADGKPIVFSNSYKDASLYWFYTGNPSYTYNDIYYHRSQYELLGLEGVFTGKEVLFETNHGFPGCDTIIISGRRFIMHTVEHFCSFNRVEVAPSVSDMSYDAGQTASLEIQLHNPTSDTICFDCPCTHKPNFLYTYYFGHDLPVTRQAVFGSYPQQLLPGATERINVQIKVPENPGKYKVLFSIGMENINPGINGRAVRMNVLSRSTENSEQSL